MSQREMNKIAQYFATKPVVRAYLFGSYARGENGPDSDIDILVTFDKEARVSLFDHLGMIYELQDLLGKDVDLVTEGMLTLTEAAKRLTQKTLLKNMSEDAAKRMIQLLRETDQVEIIVGTKINDDIQDPSTAAKIGLRFPTIDEIQRALIKNYFKECEVLYL